MAKKLRAAQGKDMKEKQKVDVLLLIFAAVCAGIFWLLFYLWSLSMDIVSRL